ncbi:hypothetical protein G7Y89_g2267 [Cudoniella acicularis]|uniref:Uncharacterized protein n=1 Tax=Cudoniella acicularis TaxID=354080 RepID=A0A8H4RVN2_9HELO|nr:hypothetical protein G7Y89_g2267 [Cudoniella acicularis]
MVSLNLVRSSNAAFVKLQPVVAVFLGSTSGIGEYSVRELATCHGTTGKGLRLYIVGRNQGEAERIIANCRQLCPTGEFKFVAANNLALLKDVDRVCDEIIGFEKTLTDTPKIDLLVMTQSYVSFTARKDTTEGLDDRMSLLYYSRMRCIIQFLPLLNAAPLGGHVISVFGPGRDKRIYPEDLSLRNPEHYSFVTMGSHAAYMTTFFLEKLAAENPQLSLVHYYPSLVETNAFWDERLPGWFRVIWRMLLPLLRLYTVPQDECGQRVIFHTSDRFPPRVAKDVGNGKNNEDIEVATSSDGILGGGAYRVNWNGEMVPTGKNYGKLREEGP